MRIVIGETIRNGSAAQHRSDGEAVAVEARLLEIRDRKNSNEQGGVVSGRVITLLVPEGYKIPRGVESGDYRIYLRFVHRHMAKY